MLQDLPRRKRRIVVTAGVFLLFLVVLGIVLVVVTRGEETYRPGERVEGITAELERPIPEDHPDVVFTDVTDSAGISFHHFPGQRTSQLAEDMGSGAAWGDYDRDGDPDLFVLNSHPLDDGASSARAALYRNEGDGIVRDVTDSTGVGYGGLGMAASFADVDADGWPDLVVSAYGELVLYANRGNGSFEDATAAAGLSGYEGYWAGTAWSDYDRDGDLDLYVTGYVRYDPAVAGATASQYEVEVPASLNPSSFQPERNLLFRNRGDGTFQEVAREAGVADPEGRSLEATWWDFDRDGWPDLYVANDVSDNVLYHNRGDGTFEDVRHEARVADYRGAMGLATGDWDGDGDPDLFVTHWIAQENALYQNFAAEMAGLDDPPSSRFLFTDAADRFGLGQVALDYVGWATSFFDYDHDGRLDLYVVNGHTFERDDAPSRLVPQRDQLFWNGGPERGFFDVGPVSGDHWSRKRVGRGGALADYDGDGDLDLFVVNHGAEAVLLRNDGGSRGSWLQVRLEGPPGNPEGIGARVEVWTEGRGQVREIGAQASYLSQDWRVAHFGLAGASRVDSVIVSWPSGRRTVRERVDANRTLSIREPSSPVP